MTQLLNQFKQTPEQGEIDLQDIGSVLSGQVYGSEVTALVPGQAVKMIDSAGGVPKFTATAADTDTPFGFVMRNPKDQTFAANARLEVGISGTIIWMTAGAAIARGAAVEYVTSSKKVITSAGINPIVGIAFDKAAADGDLVRVLVRLPIGATSGALQTVRVTATLAEINAGKVLIPGTAGKKIQVSDYIARVAGAFTTTTSVDLQDDTTGTKVTALAQAGLTNGAILMPSSSNTTLGAGFGAPLAVGEGLKVVNTGSAAAGGTSIAFTITYGLVN